MEADYIIVGQGISGTLLSRELIRRGVSVVMFDQWQPHSASRIASGLINPISGMRLVKVNKFEEYRPHFETTYSAIGKELSVPLLSEYQILSMHESAGVRALFDTKADKHPYAQTLNNTEQWNSFFHFQHGAGIVAPAWLLDMNSLLDKYAAKLKRDGILRNELFEWERCDITPGSVTYKGITAQKVICCAGTAGQANAYFSHLPFTKNKGEALIAAIPGLSRQYIYKGEGIAILPWQNDLFWVGSSFEREFADAAPSEHFRTQMVHKLDNWLKLPYKITDHQAALRPTTVDRMPFVGCSAEHPSVAIFNGMGTKGCMFAPYYAYHFANHLIDGTALPSEVSINRFKKSGPQRAEKA